MLGCNFGITTLSARKPSDVFSPANLSGLIAWYDPSDLSTLFQDAAMTTPVSIAGDPVGAILDKSGNEYHAVQNSTSACPTYQTDGVRHWLHFDGVNDVLNAGLVAADDSSLLMAAAIAYDGSPSSGSGGVFANANWKNGGVQLGYNGNYHFAVSNTLNAEASYYFSVPFSAAGVLAAFTGQGAFVYHSATGETARSDNTHAQPSVGLRIGQGTQGGRTGHFPGKFLGGAYARADSAEARKVISWLESKAPL